jgi:hypothetical protein
VESDRRLDGRQVVAEAVRVDGKELGKESELIASEGLDRHWVIGRKAARRRRDGETDRGSEDEMMENESRYHRNDATYIQSNVEPETNPVLAVVPSEAEAVRQKGQFGVRTVWSH